MVLNFLAPLEACSSQAPITSEASKSFIFLSPAEAECGRGTEPSRGCPCSDSPRLVNEALSAQDVYECMEEDFHPCDKASMKAQMPKLFCLCLVLRKGLCYAP